MRFWGKLKKQEMIIKDAVVTSEEFTAALKEICDSLDLSKPLILEKHKNEIKAFRRTLFYPDDFIESVAFDFLEIEILKDKKKAQV